MRTLVTLLSLGLLLATFAGCSNTEDASAGIGDTVKVKYVGRLAENGDVFDSSATGEPLEFKLGQGEMIPGFEAGVMGMKVGDTKTITIPSDSAYGPRSEQLVTRVPKDQIPENVTLEVGRVLRFNPPGGRPMQMRILEIDDTSIVVDANSPLAGKDLMFDLEMMEIIPGE